MHITATIARMAAAMAKMRTPATTPPTIAALLSDEELPSLELLSMSLVVPSVAGVSLLYRKDHYIIYLLRFRASLLNEILHSMFKDTTFSLTKQLQNRPSLSVMIILVSA